MTPGRHLLRAALAATGALLVLLAVQVGLAAPATAHAELVSTTPANGETLAEAPAEVTLLFTEEVRLVTGAVRLLDAETGDPVGTADPVVDGSTVRLPLPDDLADGSYLLRWRVVSADSHPISGASSFGVGEEVAAVSGSGAATGAPWPVVATRWAGYLALALVAGAVTLTALCWPAGRRDRRTAVLLAAGLVLGVVSSVLALLLQGPYLAGTPMTGLLDRGLMSEVAGSAAGTWLQLRALLYLAVGAVVWGGGPDSAPHRWGAGLGVVALAATFPGTGHAAGTGSWADASVDGVHVLTAAVWVGGLVVLAALGLTSGPRPDAPAVARFSRVALVSVAVLLATGTTNAVLRLPAWDDLVDTRYGQVLLVKLGLVAVVLAAAAVSRRAVRRGVSPWRAVRVEAVGAVVVLAATSVLTLTPPPPGGTGTAPAAAAARTTQVQLELGAGRRAELVVDGTTTAGSRLELALLDAEGARLPARAVTLGASLPAADLGPLDVPLTRSGDRYVGQVRLPLAGEWELVLTVEEPDLGAVVTRGTVRIGPD